MPKIKKGSKAQYTPIGASWLSYNGFEYYDLESYNQYVNIWADLGATSASDFDRASPGVSNFTFSRSGTASTPGSLPFYQPAVNNNQEGVTSFTSPGDGVRINDNSGDSLLKVNGASGEDDAFSMSIWVNFSSVASVQTIIWNGTNAGSNSGSPSNPPDVQYSLDKDSDDYFRFRLYDTDTNHGMGQKNAYMEVKGYPSDTMQNKTTHGVIVNHWYNVVVTYDGSGEDTGMEIYSNGAPVVDRSSAKYSYVKTRSSANNTVYIGQKFDNNGSGVSDEMQGTVASFTFWKNRVLGDSDDVPALHDGALNGIFSVMSGFISNPPRVRLNQRDSATGSYPTIIRTGDTRLGTYNTQFNDTDTVVFTDPYATAEINFSMKFDTKIIPKIAQTTEIFVSTATGPLGVGNFIEVIEPSFNENFLSPKPGDTIKLIDAQGREATFTFKNPFIFNALSDTNVIIPDNKYDRYLLARNFARKVNDHPNLNIIAEVVNEPDQKRVGKREILANGKVRLRQAMPGTAGNTIIEGAVVKPPFFARPEGYVTSSAFTGGEDIRVIYPTLVNAFAPFKLQKAGTATPNPITMHLDNGGGIIRKGIADAHITFTPGEDLQPFNDSRISLESGKFYEVGTPFDVYPGFSAPLKSKTQIVIDITPSEDQTLYRLDRTISEINSDGEFYQNPSSGFSYFNFIKSTWENTGNYIPISTESTEPPGPLDASFGKTPDDGKQSTPNSNINRLSMVVTGSTIPVLEFLSGAGEISQQFTASPQLAAANGRQIRIRFNEFETAELSEENSTYMSNLYSQCGYQNIGKPTMLSQAPASPRYFATSSQTLKMSNYIQQPFALEKIVVDLPVVYRRSHSGSYGPDNRHANELQRLQNITGSCLRDMDNFVFFAYRQTKPGTINAALTTGLSERNLLFSGSMCFFNSPSMVFMGRPENRLPQHNPAFQHDVNLEWQNDTGNAIGEKIVTASVRMEIFPAVQSAGFMNIEFYPAAADPTLSKLGFPTPTITNVGYRMFPMQHFWPGGSSTERYLFRPPRREVLHQDEYTFNFGSDAGLVRYENGKQIELFAFTDGGLADLTSPAYTSTIGMFESFADAGEGSDAVSGIYEKNEAVADPRFLKSSFGDDGSPAQFRLRGTLPSGVPVIGSVLDSQKVGTVDETPSTQSPVIIFPDDELIFGIDSGISYGADGLGEYASSLVRGAVGGVDLDGIEKTLSEVSGSFLKVLSNKPSKITLFGSQIKDKVEFHDTLNQPLTSDAIHEAIHYDNPVVDQFKIEPRVAHIGSIHDLIYEEKQSLGAVSRINKEKVSRTLDAEMHISDRAKMRLGLTRCVNRRKIYYDSLLPDLENLFGEQVSLGNLVPHAGIVAYDVTDVGQQVAHDEYVGSFQTEYDTTDLFNRKRRRKNIAFEFPSYGATGIAGGTVYRSNFFTSSLAPGGIQKLTIDDSLASSKYAWAVPYPGLRYDNPLINNGLWDSSREGNWNFDYGLPMADAINTLMEKASYPFVGDPQRRLTQFTDYTLILSKIKEITFRSIGATHLDNLRYLMSGSTRKSNFNNGAGTLPARPSDFALNNGNLQKSTIKKRIASGTSPILEYATGEDLISLLFGGFPLDNYRYIEDVGSQTNIQYLSLKNSIPDQRNYEPGYLTNVIASNRSERLSYFKTQFQSLSYGLINPRPLRHSAYYRSDRYTGQVADLVYSSPDGSFFERPTPGRLRRGRGKGRPTLKSTPAVQVKFVSGSDQSPQQSLSMKKFRKVTAKFIEGSPQLQSSNLSLFATSSLPFFDDDSPRNRTYTDPTIAV